MADLEHWLCTQFRRRLGGASKPLLVQAQSGDNLAEWVLKPRHPDGGLHYGPSSLAYEVICSSLGRSLGLPVSDFVALEVDDAFADAAPDEVSAVLQTNKGLNFGCRFQENASRWIGTSARGDEEVALFARILAFDATMLNGDRRPDNPNLLNVRGDVLLIDHSVAIQGMEDDPEALACLYGTGTADWRVRYHPLWDAVRGKPAALPAIQSFFVDWSKTVTPSTLSALRGMIPPEWWTAPSDADYVFQFLENRVSVAGELEEMLKRVAR